MTIKICRHCDMSFQRDDEAPIPHDRCERCHEEIEALGGMQKETTLDGYFGKLSTRRHGENGNLSISAPQYDPAAVVTKLLPNNQARYQDSEGEDWIDEFARTSTPEEFRGAMRFTVGKYVRRVGRKDAELSEVRKMRDYCQRWEQYEKELEQ